MKLDDWLRARTPHMTRAEHSARIAEFSARVGVTANAVKRWIIGDRYPGRVAMAHVMRETGGMVRAEDFSPIPTAVTLPLDQGDDPHVKIPIRFLRSAQPLFFKIDGPPWYLLVMAKVMTENEMGAWVADAALLTAQHVEKVK